MQGRTLLQKGFPHKAYDGSKLSGESKTNVLNIQSAISKKADKKAEANNFAKMNGNKRIADFNLRKSAAIFANEFPLRQYFSESRVFVGRNIACLNYVQTCSFVQIKSAISLFPLISAELYACAFLWDFL
ncbi:MAG: hypothetical protein K6B74_01915 [Ruminococcus sp.]|nr:hypothetical protein [Ruminococcus sp.]